MQLITLLEAKYNLLLLIKLHIRSFFNRHAGTTFSNYQTSQQGAMFDLGLYTILYFMRHPEMEEFRFSLEL